MLNPSPLISVIIPVYNVAKLLERCVDSVLTQTYHHLEIILIDDGSTDMSGKFCDVYKKRDPRIKVIHQENQGLSAARNAGLAIATGAYVTFIDSDDSVEPDLIECLLTLCQQYRTKMSICAFHEIRNPSTTPQNPPEQGSYVLNTLDCLTAMLCEEDFSVSAWGKLYARELFHDVRFPVGKIHEDVGTTYKLVLQCPEISVTPAQKYLYYANNNSITHQTFSLRKLDLVELTDRMCDDLLDWSHDRSSEDRLRVEQLTQKRRMHARFSILRQIVVVNKPTFAAMSKTDQQSFKLTRQNTVRYLRRHKNYILKNPLASRRDRLAMYSLLCGLPCFRFAWKHYIEQRQKS